MVKNNIIQIKTIISISTYEFINQIKKQTEFYILIHFLRIVINQGVLFGLIAALVFVIVILSITLPPLLKYTSDETQRKLLDEIDDTYKLMCGTPDKLNTIFDKIDSISSDNFDNKAKGIYQQIQWGKNIESCDVVYFYKQLNTEQKTKLSWQELSCNVSQCIMD